MQQGPGSLHPIMICKRAEIIKRSRNEDIIEFGITIYKQLTELKFVSHLVLSRALINVIKSSLVSSNSMVWVSVGKFLRTRGSALEIVLEKKRRIGVQSWCI